MNDGSDMATVGESQATTPGAVATKGPLRQTIEVLARVVCLAVIVTTGFTFAARYFWVAELLANLRLQQIIAIGFSLGLALAVRDFRSTAFAVLCLLAHLVVVLPQVVANISADGQLVDPIHVMSINVLTKNQSYKAITDEIRQVDPDLIAVIEMSSNLRDHLDETIAERYPHSVTRAKDMGNFGIGIFSKSPLTDIDAFELNEEIQSIEVQCRGRRLIATHPLPPMGHRLFRSRNEHLRQLAGRIRRSLVAMPQVPIITLGDFNVTPWSPHFRDFESLSGLHRVKQGTGMTPTWYARGSSFPLGLVIDHIFISDRLQADEYRVGDDIGSDHRSVSARIGAR